ncbi:MAG TPA: SDR family oxidoreductase [Vicinamibacteria bacterium]|nr:SDR family oxidoreductase [Vicinamibacteria bacterium]
MSDEAGAGGGGEVAICGLSGRFPGAADVERFWRNLCDGVESIRRFSEEELREAGEDEAKLADPAFVRARPVLEDVEGFDAALFGFSPREAEILGPQQRLFLECAWEALEDAGCDPEQYEGAVGVFAGASFSSYLVRNLYGNREVFSAFGDVQATILNVPDSLATLTGYKLGLRGPCVAVQSFCSTSLVAVHLACQSLLGYETDVALAGGVRVDVPQHGGYLYQEGGIVSADGYCRAFDARAGGTVFGSGVGVVALKRLQDALRDRDHVRAVIRGSAVNNDGARKASYAAPGVAGQRQVVVEALAAAGASADSIGYVEMHGTGTQLGDPVEVSALTQAFRRTSSRRGFCAIGSVKTNVGHLDAAAGATALIKAALCVERGVIPPSLNFETPNPQIDFAASPFFVNTALRRWDAGASPRRAGVSSFGVGGTNAHVVLEQAPARPDAEPGRPAQLLVLSAKTKDALDEARRRLARRLRELPEEPLADVAWTLQVGRRALDHRWAAVCTTTAEAVELLEGARQPGVRRGAPGGARPRVAFCLPSGPFPRPGAGRALFEGETCFREAFAACAVTAQARLGLDLRELLFRVPASDGAAAPGKPGAAEAVLFALQYAQARLWLAWGVRPAVVVGNGVGERVAACLREEMPLEAAMRGAVEEFRSAERMVGGAASAPDGTVALVLGPEPGDAAQALDVLAGLWVRGVQPDWEGVHAPSRPRRAALPSYPFERQRYWVEPKDEAPEAPAPPPALDVRSWLYETGWRSAALRSGGAHVGGAWLLFADEGGIGSALGSRLAGGAERVVTVTAGGAFAGDPETGYRIRPGEGADYAALVDDLRRRQALPSRVVHLWAVDSVADAADASAAAAERGYYSVLRLLQALGRPPGAGPIELSVVTSGLHDVVGSEPLCPEKAPLLALAVVAPQEYHELSCRSIDVDAASAEPAAIAEQLLGEIAGVARDPVVAWRGTRRWTRTVEPVTPGAGEGRALLRPGGVYLVTGGLGNLGFLIALAIARVAAGAKLALVSRTALPQRDGWDAWIEGHDASDPVTVRLKRMKALEAEGAETLALSADVADPEALCRAVVEVRRRLGPIDGVVHAAGVLGAGDFGPLQDLSREDCERIARAKIGGLVQLSRLLDEAPPFWLLTSSLSSLLGGVGYGAYAAANAFLDHVALARARAGKARWLSVAFDRWGFAGRADTTETGRHPAAVIGVREGYQLIEYLLRGDFTGNLAVSTTPLAERLARWAGAPGAPGPRSASPTAPPLRPRPELPNPFIAPRDALEREVVAFFEALLGVGPIGVADDFFALGGHSLFAARALSRLRTAFGVSLPLSTFFEAPTGAALAARIAAAHAARGGAGEQGDLGRVEIEL